MMPVGFLSAFCVAMALLAVSRLFLAEERDPIDVGTALLVLSITSSVLAWASVHAGAPTAIVATFALIGAVGGYGGISLLAREW